MVQMRWSALRRSCFRDAHPWPRCSPLLPERADRYLDGLSATEVVEKRERASMALLQLMEKEQKVLALLATRRQSALRLLADDESAAAAEIEGYEEKRRQSIHALQVHTRRASFAGANTAAALRYDDAVRRASVLRLPNSPAPFPELDDSDGAKSPIQKASITMTAANTPLPHSRNPSRRLTAVDTNTLRRLSSKGLLPDYLGGMGDDEGSIFGSAAAAAAAAADATDAFDAAHATTEAWRNAQTWFEYVQTAITRAQLLKIWASTMEAPSSAGSPRLPSPHKHSPQEAYGPEGPDRGDVTACAVHVELARLMAETLRGAPRFAGPHAAEAAEVEAILARLMQDTTTEEAVRKRNSDALLFGMLMLDDAAMEADDAGADTEEEKALRGAETPRTAARNFTVVSRRRFLAYAVVALEQLISLEVVNVDGGNDELGDLLRDAEKTLLAEQDEAAEELVVAASGGQSSFPAVADAASSEASTIMVPRGAHFGVPLEQVPVVDGAKVPVVLAQLWAAVQAHVGVDGIFRVSGEKRRYDELRAALEAGESVEVSSDDVHVVANVIKQWLRELPQHDRLLAGVKVLRVVDAIAELPHRSVGAESTRVGLDEVVEPVLATRTPRQRATLEFLLAIGVVVASQSTQNKMTKANFAVCVAPNLFADETIDAVTPRPGAAGNLASMDAAMDLMRVVSAQRQLLIYLLDWYQEKQRASAAGEATSVGMN